MAGGGGRLALALAIVVRGLVVDTQAEAQPSTVDVSMACPRLTVEQSAAMEARARAELASSRANGELVLACDAARATVSWAPAGGAPRGLTHTTDPVLVGPLLVDELLAMLHILLVERPRSSFPEAAASPSGPTLAPVRLERAANRRDALRNGPARARTHWSLLGGAEGELWQGAVGGVVGARLGVVASPNERWSIAGVSALAWGVGSDPELRVWSLSGQLRVDYSLAPFLRIGAGPRVRLLLVDASGLDGGGVAVREGKRQVGVTAGLALSARFPLVFGPVTVSAGPQLEWLVRPIVVDVANDESFRVPSLLAGFAVDLESGLGD